MSRIPLFLLPDLLAILLLLWWPRPLAGWLMPPAGINVIAIAVIYALFCVAVYGLRKLEAPGATVPALLASRNRRVALGILFGSALMLAVSHQLGYLDSLLVADARALGEGEAAVFFVLAPGAWLALALFYVLILGSEFETTVAPGDGRFRRIAFLGLLGSHAMLVTAVAELDAVVAGGVAEALILLVLLLLLFGPPRLFYHARFPGPAALISFAVVLLVAAGRILG